MEDRRDFLKKTAGAAFTTSLFTGRMKGANDRVRVGIIGIGRMGSANLSIAMKNPNFEVVAVSDIYKPHLEDGVEIARKKGVTVKPVTDFREIIADKSIDAVCISTPDHWHAYMTVEACKAGKDVYVEKPLATHIDEGKKMVEAARKYNRVVQAGTMQRSGLHFQKAAELVKEGAIGQVTVCRTWMDGLSKKEGLGNFPDGEPPAGLDWDMWLGPAPKKAWNPNRWGVHPEMGARKPFPYFRYFWDYAGGMMTDWGVHLLDIMHFAFEDPMPSSVSALGGKWWVTDNRETPDTMAVIYEYPKGFLAHFESCSAINGPYKWDGAGTLFQGTEGDLYVNRALYRLTPHDRTKQPVEVRSSNNMNDAHWQNFYECIKSRQKPISDVEKCFRTTAACILGNISLRSRMRVDWDNEKLTVVQKEAKKYMGVEYRKPWKLVV
jgi:predicted dehydrogenase